MTKRTCTVLALLGLGTTLCLLGLRFEGKSSNASGGFGIFSRALGYEGPQRYAVILVDQKKEPLVFIFSVENGSATFTSVSAGGTGLITSSNESFPSIAQSIITRTTTSDSDERINAVAFITTDAAGKAADAYGGVALKDTPLRSGNLSLLWELTKAGAARETLNSTLTLSKLSLISHSTAILSTAKGIFSKGEAGLYLTDNSLGKSCIGACGSQLFEYLSSSASLRGTE